MGKLNIGDTVEGKVTGIEDYGIFLSVDDYSGLIHISEISNGFVKNVSEYAKIGDHLRVSVLEIDEAKKQLKLSLKVFEDSPKKTKREKIQETQHGFKTLSNHLDNWIEEKIKEIKCKD